MKESGAVGAIWRDKDIRRGVAGDSLGLEVITSLTPVRSIERGAAKVGFWTPAICGPGPLCYAIVPNSLSHTHNDASEGLAHLYATLPLCHLHLKATSCPSCSVESHICAADPHRLRHCYRRPAYPRGSVYPITWYCDPFDSFLHHNPKLVNLPSPP